MSRHRTYGDRDNQPHQDFDTGFIGVNMRLDSTQLPKGYVSEAINVRFNKGIIETRPGMIFPNWANSRVITSVTTPPPPQTYHFSSFTAAADFRFTSTDNVSGLQQGQTIVVHSITPAPVSPPPFAPFDQNWIIDSIASSSVLVMHPAATISIGAGVYPIDSTGVPAGGGGGPPITTTGIGMVPWGTIYGIGVFDDPTTRKQYLIIANGNGVWYNSPNNVPYSIPLPAGVTINAPVTFTQAFDTLIMHRGENLTALSMSNVISGFSEVLISSSGDGTESIPNAARSLFFQNRLFLPFGNDEVAASDVGDYTRYLPVFDDFQINVGSSDKLVNIAKFNDTTLIAFKEKSIYAVNGVYGDLAALQLDEITNQFGLVGPKSVAHVGNDLFFLSQLGVTSLTQTQQNKLQGVSLPLSDPIQPLINRINWKYADNAVAAYWDNKYYLAVPLDDAEVLGPELIPPHAFSGFFSTVFPLTLGATYRLEMGSNESSVEQGDGTYLFRGNVTRSATTATFTTVGSVPHGLTSGVSVITGGFNDSAYNGTFVITVTGAATFTYTIVGAPPTPDPNTGGYILSTVSTVYAGGTQFVAYSDRLHVTEISPVPFTGSLRQVLYRGVNTAILVYDLLNQAWSGYDQSDGLAVNDFVILRYSGRDRLFCSSPDGFIRMLEEGFEDQLPNPYLDFNVVATPVLGDTFKINQGTLITSAGPSVNTPTQWGTGGNTIGNLYNDSLFNGGFNPISTSPWTAPNTIPVPTTNGIRFYPANGLVPTATMTFAGSQWVTAISTGTQQIPILVSTRMYEGSNIDSFLFKWISMDLQTWNPKYTIDAIFPGENEVFNLVTDRTRSRREWYKPFDKPKFNGSNTDGRFLEKYRKDYSIVLGNGGSPGEVSSFAFYGTDGGVPTDLFQDILETYKVTVPAGGVRVRIQNTQGRLRIYNCSTEGDVDQTRAVTEV